jgi:hypothetical protein
LERHSHRRPGDTQRFFLLVNWLTILSSSVVSH